jgi:FkbM family methyltransferase
VHPNQKVLKVYLDALLGRSPKVVFEIGACRGEDTAFYSRAFPTAQVYAFEPLPDNYKALCETVAVQKLANVRPSSLALADADGEALFNISSGAPAEELAGRGSSTSGPHVSKANSLLSPKSEKPGVLKWLHFEDQIQVTTSTLDSFCRVNDIARIDFIHMDVQGAELKVLSGAARVMPRTSAIWMEVAFETTYEGQPLEADVTGWMKERGFRKIHQVSYGPEGDALYLNMRKLLSWPRYMMLRLRQRGGILPR